jgi:hippurate hydrolase
MHMTCWVGVARTLVALKDAWQGTLVFIGQPAEERGGGAAPMIRDGLFEKFPKPDVCLALHCAAELSAGTLGITKGGATASVDNIDITIHGQGGHGAQPHTTKDPVVLAAQIIVALQTIDSREIHPLEPVVLTVGSIKGGTKHNIIPDKVELQLTIRATSEETRTRTLEAVKRICNGLAAAAGLPKELYPEIKDNDLFTPVLKNDDAITKRLVSLFGKEFGADKMKEREPTMGGEDFARYGMTQHRIPICMFWLGATDAAKVAEAEKAGQPLPSLHSPFFRPDAVTTLTTGVTAMSLAVMECLK